jgi:hypothetical protein
MALLVGGLVHMYDKSDGITMDSWPAWRQRVTGFVDQGVGVPAGAAVSAAARAFVGCCCGVGRALDEAEIQSQPRRLTAAQLLQLEWLMV